MIGPEKLELRLFVLPTVSVLPAAIETMPLLSTVGLLVKAPMVWFAPTPKVAPSATSTLASVPSAAARLEFKVPARILTRVPSTRLVAARSHVSVPVPSLVSVRAVPPSLSLPPSVSTPVAPLPLTVICPVS